MAERKKIVVKSTKKSAISKVEIITVESNDVASLTARHPVGVVVAERRIPSHKPTTDQEPKPVFLPGCPLPQVLPPEYKTGNEISHTKGKPSTKESKPKFYRSKNYASDHKLRKAAKTVTFSIDNDVEMGRKYNPRDYMDSTRDSTSLRQLHTLMPSAEEKKYYNETLLTGPPHYVLVSKGLKNEIDPDSTDNSNSISWDSNTAVHNFSENSHLLSGSEELSSSDGKDQISVDTNSVAVRGIKDFIESSVSVETSEISTSDTVNDNGELGIFSEAIFDKKSQETSTSDSLKDAPLSPEIPQVISVKHGSLHVRQRPHFTGETKHMQNKDINLQRNASGGRKGEIQSVVSVSKRKTEKQRATDSRNPLPVRSRPINHLGALDKYSSASNKRKMTRAHVRQPGSRTLKHIIPSCPPPTQRAVKEKHSGQTTRQVQEAKSSERSSVYAPPASTAPVKPEPRVTSLRLPSPTTSSQSSSSRSPSPTATSQSSSSRSSPTASSQCSSPSSPRVPLCISATAPHRPLSISPPTILSPTEPCDLPFDPPIGNMGGETSRIRMMLEDTNTVTQEPPIQNLEDEGRDTTMNMDDLESIKKWAEDVREELRRTRDISDLLGSPPSRLSSILQGISTGSFDEDKYLISRRVDQHVTKAFRNVVTKVKEGQTSPPATMPMPSHHPVWPSHPKGKPDAGISAVRPSHSSHGPGVQQHQDLAPPHKLSRPSVHSPPNSATLPPSQNQSCPPTFPSSQPPYQFPVHPLPLFLHSLINRGPSAPLGPLKRGLQKNGKRQGKQRVNATNLKKEEIQSNKTLEKEEDISACPHPDASRNEQVEVLAGTSDKTSLNPKVEKIMKDVKHYLKISTQASVDIPRGNITESLPGISISPRETPIQPQKKHKVVEIIHESLHLEEPSSENINRKAEYDQSCIFTDKSETEMGGRSTSTSEGNNSDIDVKGPPSPHASSADIAKATGVEDSGHQLHSYDKPQETEGLHNAEPDVIYLIEYESGRGNISRNQEQSGSGAVNDKSKDDDDHEGNLPGYMPEMRWEEVAVEDLRDEDGEENARRIRIEAEDRLCQHDLRLRILNRLEERLRELVQGEQTQAVGILDTQAESHAVNAQEDQQDKEWDKDETQNVMRAARAILGGLVRERLNVVISQVRDDEPEALTKISVGTSPSSSHSMSKDTSSSSSRVASPSYSIEEPLLEPSILKQIKTPSPSPPPRGMETSTLFTPQISVEDDDDDDDSKKVVTTPQSSPPARIPVLDIKQPQTPTATPGSSPSKMKTNDTPECTPTESPLHSGKIIKQRDTPSQSPPPQQVQLEVINAPRTPSPSSLFPVQPEPRPMPYCVFSDILVTPASPDSPDTTSPRLLDQSTQVYIPDRKRGDIVDVETQMVPEDCRNLISVETPSVICQSSSDVTISSSVEVTDVTCHTVSEGEVFSGASPVNISLEAGEVASGGCLHHITCGRTRTTALINKTAYSNRPFLQNSDSQLLRSDGEIDLDESSEGLLPMEDHSNLEEQGILEESQLQVLQGNQTVITPADSLQVSVVYNESYSSGEAMTLSTEQLTKLQQENAELLSRLQNFGSFGSILIRNYKSPQSSSSSQ